eukprot:CAMPEP_0171082380 /NCGR_PEP_ID=MMETSP0766_2-20121228/17064_1 /TAXON_ID=439317 /ORGANISM="Gambierdiscus australes, Strain CAWD 149" /LENGTH=83 /DNA_ID=CAMNT_0011539741 /DNA_START=209 /DNA_END=461 /DNA_ORIENTATION=-
MTPESPAPRLPGQPERLPEEILQHWDATLWSPQPGSVWQDALALGGNYIQPPLGPLTMAGQEVPVPAPGELHCQMCISEVHKS